MSVTDQLLPTISALVALGEFSQDEQLPDAAHIETISDGLSPTEKQQRAEQEWRGALAALTQLLNQKTNNSKSSRSKGKKPSRRKHSRKKPQALILSGPVPFLNDPELLPGMANWTLVPHSAHDLIASLSALSPVEKFFKRKANKQCQTTRLLPLLEDDPLEQEQFVLAFTEQFSMVIVLGEDADGDPRFQFSFMPQVVTSVWRVVRSRIRIIRPQQLEFIEPLVEKFPPKEPHYRIVSQFNRWMLACRPTPSPSHSTPSQLQAFPKHGGSHLENGVKASDIGANGGAKGAGPSATAHTSAPIAGKGHFSDSELLKAMAHEIRTPLTTIRTYTRSLLKRDDLDPKVIKRLNNIDRECTQQIDRFSLIFRAVELEAASQSLKSPLSAIALHQIFQDAIPQWQQAAQRRNLSLEVGLPSELPMVASDPTMLQHVLTGLVELFTHSVSPGSHIQLHVVHVGDQLKLQFQSQIDPEQADSSQSYAPPALQSLGHLLMFQPETGGLSLNLEATKNLFHALGAKLTVRERSNQGTTWTVFLPLEASGLKSYPIV
ncbi:MAG: HAMP domain-containing sensor histidine kinase [Cyanobacteria bacterium P01_F01_bin.3]